MPPKIKRSIKDRFSIVRILLLLILVTLFTLIAVWSGLPLYLEWGAEKKANELGLSNFELKVSHLDPWKAQVRELSTIQSESSFTVDKIDFLYDPVSMSKGKMNALSISGFTGNIFIGEDNSRGEVSTVSEVFDEFYVIIHKFLKDPVLSYLRARDSKFTFWDQNQTWTIDFLAKIDFMENLTHVLWEAEYKKSTLLGELNLSSEGNSTFASSKIQVEDSSALINELLSEANFKQEITQEFTLSGGRLNMDGLTRIAPDGFQDIFLELNGSNFTIGWDDKNFSIPQFLVFVTPENKDNWTVNSYLKLQQDDFNADEIHVEIARENEALNIGGGVGYLKTYNNLPPFELFGLRFPSFQLDLKNPKRVPYGEEKQFTFDELSYADNFFKFYNGSISLVFMRDNNINLRIPSIDAALLDLGISFFQFSYFGLIDLDQIPKIDTPQIISGKRVISGDEILFEDMTVTFRVQDKNHFIIDLLNIQVAENPLKLSPGNLTVIVDENDFGKLVFDFNKSSLQLLDQDVMINGIVGEIRLNSIDPLETNGTQTLSFENCTIGEIQLRDGQINFQILKDGSCIITKATAKFFDGVLEFSESELNLFCEDMLINTTFKEIDGQKIVNLFDGFEMDINGSFSGNIPFSNKGGTWDFQGGYLHLDANANAGLSYQSNGFLTDGIPEGSEEYKRMKMTELALQNLKLDSLSLTFEVEGEERQILGNIKGKSTIDKKTEVTLDYRPRVIAGLTEIINKLNLKNLGL